MGATAINVQGTTPHTILIIEDDEHLRQMTAAFLERAGFIVLQAGDANEAAELWRDRHASIDLLISDILMPGMSGPEIAREFRETRPNLKIIFASGNDRDLVVETTHIIKEAKFLRKPYIVNVLLDVVRSELQREP